MEQQFLSLSSIAKQFDMTYEYLRTLALTDKTFPAFKMGRYWRVDKAKLELWIADKMRNK